MLSADDAAIFAAYNAGDVDFIDTVAGFEIVDGKLATPIEVEYLINESTTHQGITECVQQDLAAIGKVRRILAMNLGSRFQPAPFLPRFFPCISEKTVIRCSKAAVLPPQKQKVK